MGVYRDDLSMKRRAGLGWVSTVPQQLQSLKSGVLLRCMLIFQESSMAGRTGPDYKLTFAPEATPAAWKDTAV